MISDSEMLLFLCAVVVASALVTQALYMLVMSWLRRRCHIEAGRTKWGALPGSLRK